jgi:hypothetical protein
MAHFREIVILVLRERNIALAWIDQPDSPVSRSQLSRSSDAFVP